MGSNVNVSVVTATHIPSPSEIKRRRKGSSKPDSQPSMHVSSRYFISYQISTMYAHLTIFTCQQHCAGLYFVSTLSTLFEINISHTICLLFTSELHTYVKRR